MYVKLWFLYNWVEVKIKDNEVLLCMLMYLVGELDMFGWIIKW